VAGAFYFTDSQIPRGKLQISENEWPTKITTAEATRLRSTTDCWGEEFPGMWAVQILGMWRE
jgi:hypothetical protein